MRGGHASEKMNEEYQALMERFETQERYSIVCKESNKVVGMINLQEDERAVKTYELGFVLVLNVVEADMLMKQKK